MIKVSNDRMIDHKPPRTARTRLGTVFWRSDTEAESKNTNQAEFGESALEVEVQCWAGFAQLQVVTVHPPVQPVLKTG